MADVDMKTCRDCKIEISVHATHTGSETWCEDCFDKGLCADMNDHFKNFVKEEMQNEITETPATT